jgi:hypothetical protein
VERDRRRERTPQRGCRLRAVIYCVVPEALADELYDKLVDYYKDDPNVKVIVDRRSNDRRRERDRRGERRDGAEEDDEKTPRREIRDRRNRRAPGSFPPLREG